VIDLHCHLDLYPDPRRVAEECRHRQIYVLSVTTTPSAWKGTAALAEGAPRIRTALGLHPQLAHERKGELALFARLLPETRYVGEVGLDGGPEYKRYWGDQVKVFERILAACGECGGRVLSVHSRRAAGPVLDHLERVPNAGTPIMHWFSGSPRELARAADLGCWFSVGPAMLAGEKGRALVGSMPRDRVLTETDGPFARVEGQSAYPWDASIAVAGLAGLWDVSEHEAERTLRENLRRLTSIERAKNS
jgi:TatD DNase family protein